MSGEAAGVAAEAHGCPFALEGPDRAGLEDLHAQRSDRCGQAPGEAGRVDEALALVDAQRLGVHAGQLGGHGDQKGAGSSLRLTAGRHRAPAQPARGSNPLAFSAT